MKKLLLITIVGLLVVGATGVVLAEDCVVCWSGTGDIWGTFEMGLTVDTYSWTGKWENSEAGRSGDISGTTSYEGYDYVEASGTWGETDPYGWQGVWSGTFYFPDPGDTCYGWILATSIPPGSGIFGGNLE